MLFKFTLIQRYLADPLGVSQLNFITGDLENNHALSNPIGCVYLLITYNTF